MQQLLIGAVAGQVVDQPHLPRLAAEARRGGGRKSKKTPHSIRGVSSSPFAVTHRLENSHAWICGATGLDWGRLLIHHGAEWLRAMQAVALMHAAENSNVRVSDRCAAGFEPLEGSRCPFRPFQSADNAACETLA